MHEWVSQLTFKCLSRISKGKFIHHWYKEKAQLSWDLKFLLRRIIYFCIMSLIKFSQPCYIDNIPDSPKWTANKPLNHDQWVPLQKHFESLSVPNYLITVKHSGSNSELLTVEVISCSFWWRELECKEFCSQAEIMCSIKPILAIYFRMITPWKGLLLPLLMQREKPQPTSNSQNPKCTKWIKKQ